MPTPVLMPQMGESIAEGTIVRWIKKVGDAVDRDEPLFEISTDKVDAEIPSPVAGVLTDIAVTEGQTVPVHSVVATIGEAGAAAESRAPSGPEAASSHAGAGARDAKDATAGPAHDAVPQPDGSPSSMHAPARTNGAAAAQATADVGAGGTAEAPSKEDARRAKSSPLVRKIAREHDVDIRQIHGSGIGGRVTKHDILEFLEHRTPSAAQAARPPAAPSSAGGDVKVVPLSVMRKKIAERMVLSRRTSAHVHSVFEVNFHRVAQLRDANKAEYERAGAKLTFLSFIIKAVVDGLRQAPLLNASLDGDNIVYHDDINIGVAVALDWGLIVPVVKHADEKNLLGLSRAVADLAQRARTKQLKPEEVQGGTFTITNPGLFGAQFGMPIINQPQVAILGIGTIEKRAVVIDDAIAIRPMGYLTLGFDHRLIDGAVADQFMAAVKHQLETYDGAAV